MDAVEVDLRSQYGGPQHVTGDRHVDGSRIDGIDVQAPEPFLDARNKTKVGGRLRGGPLLFLLPFGLRLLLGAKRLQLPPLLIESLALARRGIVRFAQRDADVVDDLPDLGGHFFDGLAAGQRCRQ